jgi:hypothetical protein
VRREMTPPPLRFLDLDSLGFGMCTQTVRSVSTPHIPGNFFIWDGESAGVAARG